MRRWLCPNSKTFHAMLGLALLAWTALAFGAPPMFAADAMQAAQSQSADAASHCHDMAKFSAGPHHAHSPSAPMGHGDCCHGGCHCLSTCSVALLVPFAATGVMPEHSPPRASIIADVPTAMPAPPLRPPIA